MKRFLHSLYLVSLIVLLCVQLYRLILTIKEETDHA